MTPRKGSRLTVEALTKFKAWPLRPSMNAIASNKHPTRQKCTIPMRMLAAEKSGTTSVNTANARKRRAFRPYPPRFQSRNRTLNLPL